MREIFWWSNQSKIDLTALDWALQFPVNLEKRFKETGLNV